MQWTADHRAHSGPGRQVPPGGQSMSEPYRLAPEDVRVLRRRLGLGEPVTLSAAWPKPGSWQHRYATEGRHPLECPQCRARTLRPRADGSLACPHCRGQRA